MPSLESARGGRPYLLHGLDVCIAGNGSSALRIAVHSNLISCEEGILLASEMRLCEQEYF
jgi:hypothetical protein